MSSTESLVTRRVKELITTDWPNQFRRILLEDVAPRNLSGVATDAVSALGSATRKWLDLHANQLKIYNGANAVTLKAISSLAASYALKLPSSLPASLLSGRYGVFLDQLGQMSVEEISQENIAPFNYQVSSACGNFSVPATSTWTDVTNLSVTLTLVGRPVQIRLINDSASLNGSIIVSSNNVVQLRFLEGANVIYQTRAGMRRTELTGLSDVSNTFANLDFRTTALTAGSKTIKMQALLASGSASVNNVKLLVIER